MTKPKEIAQAIRERISGDRSERVAVAAVTRGSQKLVVTREVHR
jgi:hypothetical protein